MFTKPLLLVFLVTLTLPLVVNAIPEDDFSFTVTDGEATITDYTGPGGDVVIPSTLEGYPVVAISNLAFQGNDTITSVEIPDSVTSIGNLAFNGSVNLTRIDVDPDNPDFSSVSGVLFNADHTVLRRFPEGKPDSAYEIPDSVTSIGDGAFVGCTSLERAVFRGSQPASMGIRVFSNSASSFSVFYFAGATGFSSPTWRDYPAVNLGQPRPFTEWLIDAEVLSAHYTGPATDLNHDGVSALMAYALDEDPRNDLSGRMPQAVRSNDQLLMSFPGGQPGINYTVEASTNLNDWDSAGVTLSEPDAEGKRTATVDSNNEDALFLRLVVEESGP